MTQEPARDIECVLFDLDGTLYDQRKLRWRVAWLLLRSVAAFRLGPRRIAVLRAYRRETERLRDTKLPAGQTLARHHAQRVADALGVPADFVEATFRTWMIDHALPLVRQCVWPEARDTLEKLRGAGYRLGVLSDYPVHEKLAALGLADCFGAVLSCQDPDSDGYKPHCNGFHRLAAALGSEPKSCIYVGDRLPYDIAGARAAGMRAIWLSRNEPAEPLPEGCRHAKCFSELCELVRSGSRS